MRKTIQASSFDLLSTSGYSSRIKGYREPSQNPFRMCKLNEFQDEITGCNFAIMFS